MAGADDKKPAAPAVRTVVGVPALPQPPKDDASTAKDVQAVSHAEAERVLAWTGFAQEEIPTAQAATEAKKTAPRPGVAGALGKPGAPAVKTPPLAGDLFAGLRTKKPLPPQPAAPGAKEPEAPTKAGVAPLARTAPQPPAEAPKGRTTLLLDSSAPPAADPNDAREDPSGLERPPIVVPSGSGTMPKAVTQPPPWGAGAVQVKPGTIPGPARAPAPSAEELSGSLLVPDASSQTPAVADPVELSGSVLVEDAAGAGGAPVVKPSVRPPLPARASQAPAAPEGEKKTLLGMPELPKATPAPNIDALRAAEPEPAPQPAPAPDSAGGDQSEVILPRTAPRLVAGIQRAWHRLQAMAPAGSALRDSRPKWFLPVVSVAGLVVGIGVVGLGVAAVKHIFGSSDAPAPRASVAPSVSAAPAPAPVPPPAPAPAGNACTLAGAPHVVAPSAILAAGVEAVRLDDAIALGFASDDHDAIGVRLDVASLSAAGLVKAHSADAIRRVTPASGGKGLLAVAIDADRKGDRVQGRRTVAADPPVQLGAADGHVVWARTGGAPAGKLWPLDGSSPLEAMRGVADGSHGAERTIALAFRNGGAVWVGAAGGEKTIAARGALARIEGLGTQVGSPAVAMNDGVVIVAWADRAASDDPWRLRWVRFKAGEAPTEPQTFAPPAGGPGGNVMSPGVAALPGGRFLLVWTEGPQSSHEVRALTLSGAGVPIGAAIVVSSAGVNAGQGQAAVLADGRGVVAFLESSAGGFQVAATPVTCGM